MDRVQELIERIRAFNDERDWEQFHSPKNLAMALAVEASEIMEIFQWLTQAESRALEPEKVDELREEVADGLIYLLNLSDKLDIDPLAAAFQKIEKNAANYPVEESKGIADKHTG